MSAPGPLAQSERRLRSYQANVQPKTDRFAGADRYVFQSLLGVGRHHRLRRDQPGATTFVPQAESLESAGEPGCAVGRVRQLRIETELTRAAAPGQPARRAVRSCSARSARRRRRPRLSALPKAPVIRAASARVSSASPRSSDVVGGGRRGAGVDQNLVRSWRSRPREIRRARSRPRTSRSRSTSRPPGASPQGERQVAGQKGHLAEVVGRLQGQLVQAVGAGQLQGDRKRVLCLADVPELAVGLGTVHPSGWPVRRRSTARVTARKAGADPAARPSYRPAAVLVRG